MLSYPDILTYINRIYYIPFSKSRYIYTRIIYIDTSILNIQTIILKIIFVLETLTIRLLYNIDIFFSIIIIITTTIINYNLKKNIT